MTFVLIHSPLVGPLSWKLTAEALTSTGCVAITPRITNPTDRIGSYLRLHVDQIVDQLPDVLDPDVFLVSHSGAGALLPALRAEVALSSAMIFVDCDLPQQGTSRFDQFPADLLAGFRAQASDGMLPVLWSEADLESTIVCADIRRRFVEELRPTPLRVYEEPVPVGIGVEDRDHGYVLLTKQYGDPFDIASARGWVTERRESSHFHLLNDPAQMAEILVSVGTRIGERIRNRDQTAP